jgi:carboxypeptidase C (cathepsin A)
MATFAVTQDKYFDYFAASGGAIAIDDEWRPWTMDAAQHRMGGYVQSYKARGASDAKFHFLTIRGSGHMVPEYKPPMALAFLSAWLQDDEFPRYRAPPSRR